MIFNVADARNNSAVIILKESAADVEIKTLEEYLQVKVTNMTADNESANRTKPEKGKLRGHDTLTTSFDITATDPKGIKIPSHTRLTVLKNGDVCYAVLAMTRKAREAEYKQVVNSIVESFKPAE